MSRSYRHNYIWKYHIGYGKKIASRAVRRYKGDLVNGSFYKKVYSSWDVIDYTLFYSRTDIHNRRKLYRQYIKELKNLSESKLTLEEAIERLEYLQDERWQFLLKFK